MIRKSAALAALVALMLTTVACGGDGDSDEPQGRGSPDSTQSDVEETGNGPTPDLDDIDWETVDLSTIDWATIDLAQVPFDVLGDRPDADEIDLEAMAQNPTAGATEGEGGGTFTVGGQVWEVTAFRCAIGPEETRSDDIPFSSVGNVMTPDGQEIRVVIDIWDNTETGSLDGTDNFVEFSIHDTEGEATVGWSGNLEYAQVEQPDGFSVPVEADPLSWSLQGTVLIVEGTFADYSKGEGIIYPEDAIVEGSFEATCG